jgi:transposase-like protein
MTQITYKRRRCPPAVKNQHVEPEGSLTDGLRSYGKALLRLSLSGRHRPERLHDNNRAENSHLSILRRARKMQGFKSWRSAQCFLETHAAAYNVCNIQRHLLSRQAMCVFRARSESAWSSAVA